MPTKLWNKREQKEMGNKAKSVMNSNAMWESMNMQIKVVTKSGRSQVDPYRTLINMLNQTNQCEKVIQKEPFLLRRLRVCFDCGLT